MVVHLVTKLKHPNSKDQDELPEMPEILNLISEKKEFLRRCAISSKDVSIHFKRAPAIKNSVQVFVEALSAEGKETFEIIFGMEVAKVRRALPGDGHNFRYQEQNYDSATFLADDRFQFEERE